MTGRHSLRAAAHAALPALLLCVGCSADEDPTSAEPPEPVAAPSSTPSAAPPPSSSPDAAAPSDAGPPASDAAPPAPTPPPGLVCYAKHTGGTVVQRGPTWALAFASPTLEVPWDDGRAKTFDEKLAAPDVDDVLSIRYRRGPVVPVTALNDDPGRIRHDGVLKAMYGQTEALVRAELVNVSFMGQSVPFHKKAAPALTRVAQRLATAVAQTPSLGQYVTGELGGTMTWRFIANTTRLSAHSFATAIDIVVAKSNYWEWEKDSQGRFTWTNQIPQAIVDIFESEGFAWGGRWYHYDTMHFEYRPELFDPACAP
jgi:hypothetical protein